MEERRHQRGDRVGQGHPPGASDASPRYLTNVNGILYFRAVWEHGYELWKSDGTSAGTVLVKDIRPGSSGGGPGYLTNVNGTLYFGASDGSTGYELWKSDGTSAGTCWSRTSARDLTMLTPLV